MKTTYHMLSVDGFVLCGQFAEGDVKISQEELNDPQGRYSNCTECHKVLTGGLKHVQPPEGWTDD